MANTRQRMECNGTILVDPADFEAWETTIYIADDGRLNVPRRIIRELDLKHKDRVLVAMRKESKKG